MKYLSSVFTGIICLLIHSTTLLAQNPPNPNLGGNGLKPVVDPSRIVLPPGVNPSSDPIGESIDDFKNDTGDSDENGDNAEQDDKEIIALKRESVLPDAKIWGQQFFRDQSVSIFQYSRDVKALETYEINEGDELLVSVWGRAHMSTSVTVEQDGYIDMSGEYLKIPRLYVKGMTFGDAKKAIVNRLRYHMDIEGSRWDISLNFKRNITVNIVNEVFSPGSYTMPAVNTAFNALVASGGPNQNGSVRKIQVRSGSKPTRVLDVYEFLTNPEASAINDFFLENNDFIYVPRAGRVIEIQGSINRPFFYELIEGEELKKLLFYAGGLRADAYKTNIQVIRYEDDEERLIDLNLGKLLDSSKDFDLKDGDKVIVSPIQQAYSNYVAVKGAVKLPGQYQISEDTKILEVLEKSGIIYSAAMDKVYVKRLREDLSIKYIDVSVYSILEDPNHEDNILVRPLDEIEVKSKNEFIDKYDIVIAGAIRKPGGYQYSKDLTLGDIIYMANGIRQEAIGSHIEIARLVRDGATSRVDTIRFLINENAEVEGGANYTMEAYDQIYVHQSKEFELPKNVVIEGEVRFPGIYVITDKDERVADLIERAGGLSTIAFLEGATLQRKEDGYVLLDLREMMDKDNEDALTSPFNYILKGGDVISIPKVKDLVSIAGRVNHPYIKDNEETRAKSLEIDLVMEEDSTNREVLRLKEEIRQKKNPIKVNVPFHEGKNARFYIKEYGAGIDRIRGGRKRLVYVRYSNGLVKKSRGFLFFRKYPIVEKGAMVYVEPKPQKPPKPQKVRRPVDVGAVITNTFAVLTSGLTLYLLLDRALGTTP
ncbi:MAG: SLBB domain-containing protein [Saprospiraceae bacterium]|nr:SLBB domain-containing protein [Saprospiraceae bacterium]